MTARSTCKNCDFKITDRYCPNCGQKTAVGKVTFKETIQDFVASMFSVEGPFLLTLKLLFINPGKLFRDFLSGKRKRYYKPVGFFILTTIIYLLLRSLIGFDPLQDNSLISVNEGGGNENDVGKLTLARNYMLLNIDKLLLVFVFTLALFSKLFFYKKYSLAEYVAISFYLVGIYTLLATLKMFYMQYIDPEAEKVAILVMWIYFVYAMLSLFVKGKIWVLLKSLPLFLFALLSYGLIAFGISYAIISIIS